MSQPTNSQKSRTESVVSGRTTSNGSTSNGSTSNYSSLPGPSLPAFVTSRDLKTVTPPASLSAFADPSILFISHVERRSSKETSLRRVAMLTRQSVVICDDDGNVKRFVPLEKIRSCVVETDKGSSTTMVLLVIEGEKDLLLSFPQDSRNTMGVKKFIEVLKLLYPDTHDGKPLPMGAAGANIQNDKDLRGVTKKKVAAGDAEPVAAGKRVDVTPPIPEGRDAGPDSEQSQHVPLHIEQEHELHDLRNAIDDVADEIQRRRSELQSLQNEAIEVSGTSSASLTVEIENFRTQRDHLAVGLEAIKKERALVEKTISDHETSVGFYNEQIRTQLRLLNETLEREKSQRDAYIQMKLLDTEDYYHTLLLRKHDEGDQLRARVVKLANVNESLRAALQSTSKGLHL